jgi:predicted nucleic acid-binding protein
MRDKYFLDTNVLVYTFDPREPHKQTAARRLVSEALSTGTGIISCQVAQEFLNVATRKFERPLTSDDCQLYLAQVLAPLCEVFPSIDLLHTGLSVASRFGFSFYDALIVAAALHGNCRVLYSEDMQHGQTIDRMVIQNPFRIS